MADEVKMILEINGKPVLILPDNPYRTAVCDDLNTPKSKHATRREKLLLIKWIEKYLK